MEERRFLLHLLSAFEKNFKDAQMPPEDFVFSSLLNLKKRLLSIKFYLDLYVTRNDVEDEFLYKKVYTTCRSMYLCKEYSKSFKMIIDHIYNGKYFTIEFIKLLLACIYCLGYFTIAAVMYKRWTEISTNIEIQLLYSTSLFYSGDVESFKQTLSNVSQKIEASAISKSKYKDQYNQALSILNAL